MKHLPHSIECEKSLLGCVILDVSILPKTELNVEDFYESKHRTIFAAMQSLYAEGSPIEIPSLAVRLGKDYDDIGGIEYLGELMGSAGGSANYGHYCDVIREKKNLRDIISLSAMLNNKCLDDPNKETISTLLKNVQTQLSSLIKTKTISSGSLDNFVKEQIEYTQAIINGDIVDNSIKTGFADLDKNIGGLRPGNLVVVAARPGAGKTALALDFALNAMRKGHQCAYYSLEMTCVEISRRLISKIANVGLKSLTNGMLSVDEIARVKETTERGYLGNMHISEENIAPAQLETFIDNWNATHDKPISVVFVDHLQLTGLHDTTRYERRDLQLARYTGTLKDIAKRKQLCVVLLSQLNRSMDARNKEERFPKLSDLRDSGAIEQDADIVLGIYRKGLDTLSQTDQDTGVLLVLKNRNGQVGVIDLQWVGSRATYRSRVKEEIVHKPKAKQTVSKPEISIHPFDAPRAMIDPDTGRQIYLDAL